MDIKDVDEYVKSEGGNECSQIIKGSWEIVYSVDESRTRHSNSKQEARIKAVFLWNSR